MIANLLDGGFFGLALGFASFVTIIPLFVSTLTDSAVLIGLVPAIHTVGWQLPQLLTARRVARQRRYKPMVMWMTLHERLPFLGLALVAWLLPRLGRELALGLTFLCLVWQGLGGGFTATPWQSLIAKIFPPDRRGTFYGVQSSVAYLLSSGSAVAAGFMLARLPSPVDYAACFLLCSLGMVFSYLSLAQTREHDSPPPPEAGLAGQFWRGVGGILRSERNFRWFLVVRMLSPLATLAFAFYTVYAVRRLGMSEVAVGLMTGVYLGAQVAANPLMGWLGDRHGHRLLMEAGLFCAAASAALAWAAPGPGWFYGVFTLAGVANVSVWTIANAMLLEFGDEAERPAYIGLANTLVAPFTFMAPLFGGWVAERWDYPAAFLVSAAAALATWLALHFGLKDPRRLSVKILPE